MIERVVTERYTEALLEIAVEKGIVDQIERELEWTDNLIKKNREIIRFFTNPIIPAEKKKGLIDKVIVPGVSALLKNFFYLLVDRKRSGILVFLLEEYKNRVNKLKGVVKAEVETAIPISSEKIGSLRKRLEDIFKKKIKIETKVIPSIIGGIKVTVESKVIDITLVNRLKNLKERLLMA